MASSAQSRRSRGAQVATPIGNSDGRTDDHRRWWMLVHQLPPDPPGLRMRVWRRLQDLGALQIKGSVYVLPGTDAAREDLQWLLGEIRNARAEASLWSATAIDGLDDVALVRRFQAMAATEYGKLEAPLRQLRLALGKRSRKPRPPATTKRVLAKLRTRFVEIGRRDHFAAPRREVVGALLADLDLILQGNAMNSLPDRDVAALQPADYRQRTWVTRAQVHVDRMACAWLIQRYIDTQATIVFSRDGWKSPHSDGLRFDMYEGEFSHEGDLCSFEVMLRRFGLLQPGLVWIAELVHDIDLKESRYAHPETIGIAASLDAIAAAPIDDPARIAMAGTIFDGLLQRFESIRNK